jgi:hypothetical protein
VASANNHVVTRGSCDVAGDEASVRFERCSVELRAHRLKQLTVVFRLRRVRGRWRE